MAPSSPSWKLRSFSGVPFVTHASAPSCDQPLDCVQLQSDPPGPLILHSPLNLRWPFTLTLHLPQASPLLASPVLAPGHTLLFAVPKTSLFRPGASMSAQHTQGQVSTRLYRINHCPQGHPGPLTLLCFCFSPKPLLRQPFAPFCVCCYYHLLCSVLGT